VDGEVVDDQMVMVNPLRPARQFGADGERPRQADNDEEAGNAPPCGARLNDRTHGWCSIFQAVWMVLWPSNDQLMSYCGRLTR
jgi:hypothetical protein